MKAQASDRLMSAFGSPSRRTAKVCAWDIADGIGAVLQVDQPKGMGPAILWLPYPAEGQAVPDIALVYASETGRHSGTYASPGLKLGEPALKLKISTQAELEETIAYVQAMRDSRPLPVVRQSAPFSPTGPIASISAGERVAPFPEPAPMKPRREAIPRAVQREVWQRDGGRCVECDTRERLCFDHIVPHSRGGANTVRNVQLLCEGCNLSKGNRL